MIQDEFNKVVVTNDKQLRGVEFGKTQFSESTSKSDNKIPEGDLNEKYVGKTIKKVTEVNVEYIKKVPTHTTTTVVQSSATTATSAAAAAASTVVAASTVAVVAVATATGISVALHNYQCELTSLLITSNEISYSFSIVDTKKDEGIEYQTYEQEPRERINPRTAGGDEPISEDYDPESLFDRSRPFVLRVSNGSYESEHFLDYGNSEYGTFSGLTLGDTYSIVLKENRYGGETLFEEQFTTYLNSAFREFYIGGDADFRRGTFNVYLDYVDELECLNSFEIIFEDKEIPENKYVIPMENVIGYQEVSVRVPDQMMEDFDFTREYNYAFNYKNNEDVITFQTGEISFYNISSYTSEMYGVYWDGKANFLTNQTAITLDFVDDYDIFSNFKLVLMPEEQMGGGDETLVYALDKTTEEQFINLYENEEFNYVSTYSYMFTYMQEGQEMEQIIDSGSGLKFEDNSGTEARGVSWDKTANFITKEIALTLDYTDMEQEEYQRFSNFQLTLKDAEMPEEMYDEPYDLVKTTEEQIVTLSSNSNIRLRRTLTYAFTYYDVLDDSTHILEEGTVEFTDNSNGQKEFNGITINKMPDMENDTIMVQLDYVDDYNELSNFQLNLYIGDEDPMTFYLDTTTELQVVDVANSGIDYTKTYNYFVTYYDEAVFDEISAENGSGTITFYHSNFIELIFDKTGNFDTMAFDVQLDFVDDLDVFSEFTLTLKDDNENEKTFNLEKTTEVQTLFLDDKIQDIEDEEIYEYYKFSMRSSLFTYTFKYYDSRAGEYITTEPEQFRFTNTLRSVFEDVVSPFDFTTESGGQAYLLPLRFEYNDLEQIYNDFDVQIWKGEQSLSSFRFEGSAATKNWIYGVYVPDGGNINDLINADDTSVKVYASIDTSENPQYEESEILVYEEDVVFTLDQHKEIYGGHIVTGNIMYNMDIGFQLVYTGQPEDYINCKLVLEAESGNVYKFNISQLSPGNNYCCIYMDSDYDEETGSISESAFYEDFINHPMKISIEYYIETTSGTGQEGPYTAILHESYQFSESV